jgi:50S ribosomal subunit-associated GTPase HflX
MSVGSPVIAKSPLLLEIFERTHHSRQGALHVIGAAADQAVPFDAWLELLLSTGHDVEMAVKHHARHVVA